MHVSRQALNMGFEIDFLPVGSAGRSGDAIAIRWGNLRGSRSEQTVMTIDGGTKESGAALVEHVQQTYKTNTVDFALLTHPDGDHAYGMGVVLEKLNVSTVLMHLPWKHSQNVLAAVDDDRYTISSLSERSKKRLIAAHDAFKLAKSTPLQPFAGNWLEENGGKLTFLGPSEDFYQNCLSNYRFMPGTDASNTLQTKSALSRLAEGIRNWLWERFDLETLREPPEDATSHENNSSTIFLLEIEGRKFLFTGDAGVPALTLAANFADRQGISLENLSFLQVPHHGSRKNLGPTILNRLFGSPRQHDIGTWTAYISAASEGEPKHPHKKVMNALRRRGGIVHVTAGLHIRHAIDAPPRQGWMPLEKRPFYQQVEDDD